MTVLARASSNLTESPTEFRVAVKQSSASKDVNAESTALGAVTK
jgi:hypothetical protein